MGRLAQTLGLTGQSTAHSGMKTKIRNCSVVLFFAALSAQAQLYKCMDDTGNATYSDRKCESTKNSKRLSITDNTVDATEVRESIQREIKLREDTSQARQSQPNSNAAVRIGPSVEERACHDAIRDYDIEVSLIRKDVIAMNRKHIQATEICQKHIPMHETHVRLAAVALRKGERANETDQQPNRGNLYIRQGNGYISPRGEFCQAVMGGAVCPTGGYIKIHK